MFKLIYFFKEIHCQKHSITISILRFFLFIALLIAQIITAIFNMSKSQPHIALLSCNTTKNDLNSNIDQRQLIHSRSS